MKNATMKLEQETGRKTFRQILDTARRETAHAAWERARLASGLRHWASRHGRMKAAATLAGVKADALARAATILPDEVNVGIDCDYQIGLVSVAWRGHGRLHLPADTAMPSVA